MPIVVDGNNLLHQLPHSLRSRSALRSLLLDLVRREGMQVTVVFDGGPPAGTPAREHLGRVTVLYAAPRSADEVILASLPRPPRASTFAVVTDDRRLGEQARRAGARLRPLRAWVEKLLDDPPRPQPGGPLRPDEVAEWEAFFARERENDD